MGPKEQHHAECPGFSFYLKKSQNWSLKSLRPGNANRSKQKHSNQRVLSLAKGPGKGQPRKMENLNNNHCTPVTHHKKSPGPTSKGTVGSLEFHTQGYKEVPVYVYATPHGMVSKKPKYRARTFIRLASNEPLSSNSINGDHMGSLDIHPHTAVRSGLPPQISMEARWGIWKATSTWQ